MNTHFYYQKKITYIFPSPFYSIPTCLYGLGNQGIVKYYKTERMVPHQGNQWTESQSRKHNKGQILYNLLCDSPLKKVFEYVVILRLTQNLVPPQGYTVRGVVVLLHVSKIEGMCNKVLKERCPEVDESLPDRF